MRQMSTPYIEWAKLNQAAQVNLAVSGMPHVSAADLGSVTADLPLSGSNGYGYPPLLEAIGAERPLGQLMSGSGSTPFALCRDRAEARRLARALRTRPAMEGCKVFAVRTLAARPTS